MAVKVGIIGVGNIGSAHANAIASGQVEGMELAALCDLNEARQIPGIPFYSDYRELLKTNVEAVIIAVPHPLHGDIAMDAFRAGKHVLTEKPMDITVSKARQMIDAAGDRVFGIMFNQRTGNLFQKARQLLQDGLLGQLQRCDWTITNWFRTQHYYDSGSWRATWTGEGGGVLMNQAPHQLDLWQWICGMPEAVWGQCHIGKYHDIEVEDLAVIHARFPGGAIGTFTVSTGEFPGTNRMEIVGTKGKLVLEDGKLKWWCLAQDTRDFSKESMVNTGKIPFTYQEFEHESAPGHRLILEDFARGIATGSALLAPGKEGIRALSIQNAAYLSSWKGGVWVNLPFDEEEYNRLLAQHQTDPMDHRSTNAATYADYDPRWQISW